MFRKFITSFGALVNIAPHEWMRVIFGWSLRFFWQVSYMMSWTILTVLTVDYFGVERLPYFYIANAIFIIFGTLLFSGIIHRFARRKFMAGLSVLAALMFFVALQFRDGDVFVFFQLALIAFSILLAQLQILLSLFIEDLFSPSESARTFPIIESAETIGGIVSGLVLAVLVAYMEPETMLLVAAGFVLLMLPVLVFFGIYSSRIPHVLTREEYQAKNQRRMVPFFSKVRQGFTSVRKISFLKGFLILVLSQWMVFTVIQFQFTNAVTSEVEVRGEYLVQEDQPARVNLVADVTKLFEEGKREIEEDVGIYHAASPEVDYTEEPHTGVKIFRVGEKAHSVKEALTHSLGLLHVIFSALALVMQLLFASRIIGRFGILSSIIIYIITSIGAVFGMTFRYGFATASIARGNDEVLGVLYRNSYHTSYYTLRENIRDYVKEFFDGIARPCGIILGTLFIIVVGQYLVYSELIFANNILLIVVLGFMLVTASRLRARHTLSLQHNIATHEDTEAQFDAVELLSQPGHKDAHEILLKHLAHAKYNEMMIVHILHALGKISHPHTLPEILKYLESDSNRIQIAALDALIDFKGLGQMSTEKLFTRHRVLHVLQDLFVRTRSKDVRKKIVRVFEGMHDMSVVSFLLRVLETAEDEVKADCIYVMGLFQDVTAAFYIEPCLNHKNARVSMSAAAALWPFPKYRLKVLPLILSKVESSDKEERMVGIQTLGDIGAYHETPRLKKFLKSEDSDIAFAASFALLKLGDASGIHIFVDGLIHEDPSDGLEIFDDIDRLPDNVSKSVFIAIRQRASKAINDILSKHSEIYLSDYPVEDLERLKYFYTLTRAHHELMRVLNSLDELQQIGSQ